MIGHTPRPKINLYRLIQTIFQGRLVIFGKDHMLAIAAVVDLSIAEDTVSFFL
jgi:hypothetical protein